MKFISISTGIEIKPLVERCKTSLKGVDHRVFALDDSATGGNGAMLNFIVGMYHAKADPEDVIMRVDADDQMAEGAMPIIREVYKDPNILLTYGSTVYESGKPARFQGAYKTDKIRTGRWYSPHLLTFKAKLWEHIKEKDFKDRTNHYFKTACDLAIFYPLIEMAGLDRVKHISEPTYIYNDLNPKNVHKLYAAQQKRDQKIITRRPPYKRLKNP